MRLLAFSDLHHARNRAAAIVAASAGADLVIGAGDFCNHRQGLDAALALLSGLRAPMIAVPGNAESVEELTAAAGQGTTVLHGTETTFGTLKIFGLGYAVPVTPFGSWSCDLTEEFAEAQLNKCVAADILICHAPPRGVADRSASGQSLGSTAIRSAVERLQPDLFLCGHIHDSWGQEGRIGATRVVNLGPIPTIFEMETP